MALKRSVKCSLAVVKDGVISIAGRKFRLAPGKSVPLIKVGNKMKVRVCPSRRAGKMFKRQFQALDHNGKLVGLRAQRSKR